MGDDSEIRAPPIGAFHHHNGQSLSPTKKDAKGMIQNGQVDEGTLNRVEMAFRAYDPCLACAVHVLDGNGSEIIKVKAL